MKLITRYTVAILVGVIIPIVVFTNTTKRVTAAAHNLGFAPGVYRGLIADVSPANTNNYVHIEQPSALIDLEPLSSIALLN